MATKVLCIGEALIDVVEQGGQVTEHVGGSLLNVACGLARLGHDSTLRAWLADDERGARIARAVTDAGAQLADGTVAAERTPVAYARVNERGHATYTFELDWQMPQPLLTEAYQHLHTGSIACTLEPGGGQVLEAVRRMREQGTVSYDPNVRPALMADPAAVLPRIEELISLAEVVKASDEDLAWLYPGRSPEAVLCRLLELGPSLVVITRGGSGALAGLVAEPEPIAVEQITVEVADTVGAGDSFMAGLISGLSDAGLLGDRAAAQRLATAGWNEVRPALQRAIATAAITVSHAGAYGPVRAEVDSLLAGDAWNPSTGVGGPS